MATPSPATTRPTVRSTAQAARLGRRPTRVQEAAARSTSTSAAATLVCMTVIASTLLPAISRPSPMTLISANAATAGAVRKQILGPLLVSKHDQFTKTGSDRKLIGNAHNKTTPSIYAGENCAVDTNECLTAGAQNAFFAPFLYKNDDFTKTGSGQTYGKLKKRTVFSSGCQHGAACVSSNMSDPGNLIAPGEFECNCALGYTGAEPRVFLSHLYI